jgi:hypothetical protein
VRSHSGPRRGQLDITVPLFAGFADGWSARMCASAQQEDPGD